MAFGLVSSKPMLVRRRHKRQLILKAPRADITPHIAGQFLTTFVLFTASMNWLYYRKLRKDHEKK